MQILDKFHNEIQPRFSVTSLAASGDYKNLRETQPLLLQVVMYVASSGLVSNDVYEEIAQVVFSLLTPDAIAKAKKYVQQC